MRSLIPLLACFACTTPPPGVESVSPPGGPPGTTVVVVGSGFEPGTTVTLGDQPLAGLEIADPRQLSGRVGALAPGEHDLVIRTPSGGLARIPRAFAISPGANGAAE